MICCNVNNISVKDYCSLLTLKDTFGGNEFCLNNYNQMRPIFPCKPDKFINSLLKNGFLEIKQNTADLASIFPDYKKINIYETTFTMPSILPTPCIKNIELETLGKEIDSCECFRLFNLYIKSFRSTDNYSIGSITQETIIELRKTMPIEKIFHLIMASHNSYLHLVKKCSFNPICAAGQFISYFKKKATKMLSDENRTKRAKDVNKIPNMFYFSRFYYIYYLLNVK